MTDRKPAAIEATYATYRPVPSRAVFQIVCELPIEHAEHALETLGQPGFAGKQVWVAIALMNKGASEPVNETPKRERTLSNRCDDYCRKPLFWEWLSNMGWPAKSHVGAAAQVRIILKVSSRSEMDRDEQVAARWQAIAKRFDGWEMEQRHADELEKQG